MSCDEGFRLVESVGESEDLWDQNSFLILKLEIHLINQLRFQIEVKARVQPVAERGGEVIRFYQVEKGVQMRLEGLRQLA